MAVPGSWERWASNVMISASCARKIVEATQYRRFATVLLTIRCRFEDDSEARGGPANGKLLPRGTGR